MASACKPLLTTGQAARLLSVTPDTVLKWIRAGKLPAARTAGGHHRISPVDISRLAPTAPSGESQIHCWEFFQTSARLSPRCHACPAYRFRAARCFEVRRAGLSMPGAFDGCPASCETCPFYLLTARAPLRVVAATPDEQLRSSLARMESESLELRFASSPLEAAAAVTDFRPDAVLLDCEAFPPSVWKPFLRFLKEDPRFASSRVALLGLRPRPVPPGAAAVLPRRLSLRRLLRFASRRAASGAGAVAQG